MRYDFVLQQENINMEMPYFSKQLRLNPDYPYPRQNVNGKMRKSNVYRYDKLLRVLEKDSPQLFSKILEKY